MLKSVTRSADGDVALLPTFRTGKSFRGAATPSFPCLRGHSTVEFHEGRLAEARTAASSHQASWLRYLVGWP
jgi:hypothetical protein